MICRQITTFIKVRVAFVFGTLDPVIKYFSEFYQSKGLDPNNVSQMKFYECCDLTKKVFLEYTLDLI